jgi:very-short-patch-repair endonuclease
LPPHPALSPEGEEEPGIAPVGLVEQSQALIPPLPSGRGQGEGAASRQTSPVLRRSQADITKRRPGKTVFARTLRADETEEEYFLWSDLRNRRLNGHKFARQIPLGSFVVDFLCREKHLVIELDGGQHCESEHDTRRTKWLNVNGYSVIRFWNNEVRLEREAVLETILAVLEGRISVACDAIRYSPCLRPSTACSPPHPALSPRGEGKLAIQTARRGTF